MFGTGLLKGLGVTMKHFVETYIDDVKAIPSRYTYGQDFIRQTPEEEGIFTIQYPEEKRQLPERFRYIPMLIYDTAKQEDRCTACGICAKVCPPQCIWIVRDSDESGKPVPQAAEFYIDASICMSCGFCAEFCPFDAIKMNHDYELAVYQRYPNLVYNMEELTVPVEYYAALYPVQYAEEEQRRAEEEAKKAKRQAARKKPAAAKAEPKQPRTSGALSPEELEKRRAEAKARAAARKAAAASEAAEAPAEAEAPAGRTSGTLSAEELERRRAEAKARVAARKGLETPTEAVEPTQPAAEVEPKEPAKPAAPAAEAAVAAVAGFGKPQLAQAQRTSGNLSYEELEKRRAESYARYKDRKGADAKELHAGVGAAAAPQPAPPPPAEIAEEPPAPEPTVEAKAEAPTETPVEAEVAAPKPETAAAPPGSFGKPHLAQTQRTSGTLSYEELEKRRAESYARYKARKGADAKVLGPE